MAGPTSAQVQGILSELEFAKKKIRLVKCLAVHNEEGWIEYNLRNNYDEFDVIRVVEGAVQGRPNSTPDGHSTDRTIELIRNFPDPAGKIELYTQERFFKSLEEQKQIFLDTAQDGDWLFIVDCDEFYQEGDIARVRKAIQTRPNASEIIPTFLHFYRDFGHIRDYGHEWNLWHQRIIRWQPGLRYYTHPIVTDKDGKCTYFAPEYQLKRYMVNDLFIYHYGHAKGKEFHEMKRNFYRLELEKFKLEDGKNASNKFDEKFLEFINETENLNEVLEYSGKHPGVLINHPLMQFRHSKYQNLKDFRTSLAYNSKLPTLPQWMIYQKRMYPIYNYIEV